MGLAGSAGTDLSFIKVSLLTADGVLKDSADCDPNGYYFFPLYDIDHSTVGSGTPSGGPRFVLRVDEPAGWSFRPAEATVAVVGGSDGPSVRLLNRAADAAEPSPLAGSGLELVNLDDLDVNFELTGFAIAGAVLPAAACADGRGTAGVTVTATLASAGAVDAAGLARTAVVDAAGRYVIVDVPPGQYTVAAAHPSWQVGPQDGGTVRSVTVGWRNTEVRPPLAVAGYPAAGVVVAMVGGGGGGGGGDGGPAGVAQGVGGVTIYLHAAAGHGGEQPAVGCSPPPDAQREGAVPPLPASSPLCMATTGPDGRFVFLGLPCGSYTAAAAAPGLELAPAVATLNVQGGGPHRSLPLPSAAAVALGPRPWPWLTAALLSTDAAFESSPAFELVSFAAAGRVLHADRATPVPGPTLLP